MCHILQEYWWSIGTRPGSADIQNLTSVGQETTAENNALEGVLQSNTTYYVTVTAENGAGLKTIYVDYKGECSK